MVAVSHGGWRYLTVVDGVGGVVGCRRLGLASERWEMKIMIRFVKMRCVVRVLSSKGLMLPFSLRLGVALVLHKHHLCNLVKL